MLDSDKELINYINNSLSSGIPLEKIKANLIIAGWEEEKVDSVMNKLVSISDIKHNSLSNFETSHEVNFQNYQERKKDLSPLHYLLGAIILEVTGFGVCLITMEENLYIFISLFTIINLLAAVLAFMSIIKVNQVDKITGLKRHLVLRIIITILAILVGGWGIFWGGWGLMGAK